MGKYDKLIKENLAYIIAPLALRIGIDLERGRIEIVKDKLQYTIEREPDFLFKSLLFNCMFFQACVNCKEFFNKK